MRLVGEIGIFNKYSIKSKNTLTEEDIFRDKNREPNENNRSRCVNINKTKLSLNMERSSSCERDRMLRPKSKLR